MEEVADVHSAKIGHEHQQNSTQPSAQLTSKEKNYFRSIFEKVEALKDDFSLLTVFFDNYLTLTFHASNQEVKDQIRRCYATSPDRLTGTFSQLTGARS
ncbi:hypothetical protein HUJ05_005960 [Dendroctonus ponderosae]|nr:hypothetical protein HUJ05_005960 [Dendroctonus ponderosae]